MVTIQRTVSDGSPRTIRAQVLYQLLTGCGGLRSDRKHGKVPAPCAVRVSPQGVVKVVVVFKAGMGWAIPRRMR